MQTPSFVSVHLHMPIIRLHWHIIMPFIMQHMQHMPPAIILHMFCKVAAVTSSSQEHMIFTPPWHFSILISQRGTMHMLPMLGIMDGMPDIGWDPIMEPIIVERSNIIVLDIETPFQERTKSGLSKSVRDAADQFVNPALSTALLWTSSQTTRGLPNSLPFPGR